MTNTDQKYKYEYWQNLIEAQQASGLSQKEFCKQRDLVLSQFVYYRCKFNNESPSKESGFMPVKVSNKELSASAACDIKLVLPNGFQCIFPSHTDCSQVKKLIEVLLSC
jgi:hypothetical protein